MPRYKSRSSVWVILIALVTSLSAFASQPALIIVSPRGGEIYADGSTQLITLDPHTRYKSVLIELSRDGGQTWSTIGTINNTVKDRTKRNILSWTLSNPPSSNAVIRATATTKKGSVTAISAGFIIGSPQFITTSLPAASVTEFQLADGSVTTPKLANGAVTTIKVAADAITADKIGSGAASGGFVLEADGNGGVAFTPLPATTTVSNTAGNSILVAINDPGTIGTINAAILTGTAAINITGNANTATTANGVTDTAGNSIVTALNNPATTTQINASILTGTAGINISGNAATATTATNANTANGVSSSAGNSMVTALNDPATTSTLNAGILTGTAGINITGNAATATSANGVANSAGNSLITALNNAATTSTINAATVSQDPRYVLKTGDTMTGALTLNGDPAAALQAATKQYVDASQSAATGVSTTAGNSLISALNAVTTTSTVNAGILSGTAPISITGNAATATTATTANGVSTGAGNSIVAALNNGATTSTVNGSVLTAGSVTNTQLANGSVDLTKLNTTSTDTRYVLKAGDTMTGTLTVNGTGQKFVAQATTSDETTGNVHKIEVRSSASNPVFSVNEVGLATAATVETNTVQKTNGTMALAATGINPGQSIITASTNGSERLRIDPTGNVGIGTQNPGQKLSVVGIIETTSGGVKFPDATIQTTAAISVPSTYSILGNTTTPPSGYTYSGGFLSVSGAASWTAKAMMPTARSYSVAAMANNKVYVFGGTPALNVYYTVNEEYDPASNAWSTQASMSTARFHAAAATDNNNIIYVIGGENDGLAPSILSTNEAYNTVANSWSTKAPMPTARAYAAAAAVNGKIYVISGYNGAYLSTNEEYDPSTNTWSGRASMPAGIAWATAAVVNNKIYVIGGENSTGSNVSSNYEYDPASDTWATKTSMPTPRKGCVAGAINNTIYVAGGSGGTGGKSHSGGAGGSGGTTVNEQYDPSTNAWTTRPSMLTDCAAGTGAVVNSKLYVIGDLGGSTTNQEFDASVLVPPATMFIHTKN